MEKVAFSACLSNAVEDVKEVSQYLYKNREREDAFREFVDLIIKNISE